MAEEVKAIEIHANVEDGVLHVKVKADIVDLLDDLAKDNQTASWLVDVVEKMRDQIDWKGIKKEYS